MNIMLSVNLWFIVTLCLIFSLAFLTIGLWFGVHFRSDRRQRRDYVQPRW